MSYDVAVIGAGPAGLAAADTLVKLGRKVALIESQEHSQKIASQFFSEKGIDIAKEYSKMKKIEKQKKIQNPEKYFGLNTICGDHLRNEIFIEGQKCVYEELINDNIHKEIVKLSSNGQVSRWIVFSPNGKIIPVDPSIGVRTTVINRKWLQGLWLLKLEVLYKNMDMYLGWRAKNIKIESELAVITVSDKIGRTGKIKTRTVVDASGFPLFSKTNLAMKGFRETPYDFDLKKLNAQCYSVYLRIPFEKLDRMLKCFGFGDYLSGKTTFICGVGRRWAPGGFWWIIPGGEKVSVGLGVRQAFSFKSDFNLSPKMYLERLFREFTPFNEIFGVNSLTSLFEKFEVINKGGRNNPLGNSNKEIYLLLDNRVPVGLCGDRTNRISGHGIHLQTIRGKNMAESINRILNSIESGRKLNCVDGEVEVLKNANIEKYHRKAEIFGNLVVDKILMRDEIMNKLAFGGKKIRIPLDLDLRFLKPFPFLK